MSVGNRTVLLAVLRPLLHFIRNKRSTVIRHLNTRLHICRSIARVDIISERNVVLINARAMVQWIVACCLCAVAVVASAPQSIPLDKNTLTDSIKAGKPLFVKFFAPWCEHCKNLEPTWNELADKLSRSQVTIAEVDCTVETAICAEQGVRAYPTLKYYEQAAYEERYHGSRDIVSLVNFVNNHLQKSENIVPAAPTDETFVNYLETTQGIIFVDFFAPWCDQCVKLAPIWDQLANHFSADSQIHIIKLDCSTNPKTCQRYGVDAVPTLLLFEAGLVVKKYTGSLTLESLLAFVTSNAEGASLTETENKVAQAVPLVADNFTTVISGAVTFVKFYAPWCGHCISLAPTWDELAREMHAFSSVIIAKVDCTAEEQLCKEHQIRAYPTLILFKEGGAHSTPYNGARDIQSLKTFIKNSTQ